MTNYEDAELREWTADWNAAGEGQDEAAAIRRRIRASTVRQGAFAVIEVVVAVAALALVIGQALRVPEAWNVAAMAALAVMTIAALAFTLWNRTGTWKPAAGATDAYVDLLMLRLRRRLRALHAGLYLLATEAAILTPWLLLLLQQRATRSGLPATAERYALALMLLAVWLGLFAGGSLWLIRQTRRELANLERMHRELADSDASPEQR